MDTVRILVVDDESITRENLTHILNKEKYQAVAVENGLKALRELEKTEYDLVLTDLRMEQVDGMQVLKRAKELYPETEVIMITGYATISSAVEAMQKGAYHYIAKPFNLDEVRLLVHKALEKRMLQKELIELKRQMRCDRGAHFIIGKSPKMQALNKLIAQVAPADCNVLIEGETGTGKELVARAIHLLSPRAAKRFLAINCGAFNEELLANELFGHEKEAFTGAQREKEGLLEAASGGTVLLDEIADMQPSMQVKLLRTIQEKRIMRVGGTREVPVDIRILGASNRDLRQEVNNGTFREDLYYRLNVITLHVPPLSERKDDIPLLCHHFLHKFAGQQGKEIEGVSPEVMDALMDYAFPGNIRELENIVERAVTLANGPRIEMEHLPMDLQQLPSVIRRHARKEILTLEENEKEYIAWVLQKVQGSRTKAAELLGIDRVSLWRKIKRYQLER
ncbi:MAG: sigma-54-dependent Fis family transcriptional regulator [Deltaproteobacteria bacterium]|nr:sigma-54-dependent Fis family transcriptional regulator [Deltaproteobacteria bacterium]